MIKRLYKLDRNGTMRFWQIEAMDGGLMMTFGVDGGEEVEKFHPIDEGKANRDQDEQIFARFDARVKKYIENKGYSETEAEAIEKDNSKNQLGFYKPMLATAIPKEILKQTDIFYKRLELLIQKKKKAYGLKFGHRNPLDRAVVQYKFNGHRCLIKNEGGDLIAYSRGGELINSIDHILEKLEITIGTTIDGELYVHGKSLQYISSLVRRKQEDSKLLSFMCYDVISNDCFLDRYRFLKTHIQSHTNIHLVHHVMLKDINLNQMFRDATLDGYEGLIVRLDGFCYEVDTRSLGLIKIKNKFSREYTVVDIVSSVDDWAVLVCDAENGETFSCSAHGTVRNKKQILKDKEKHIGREVTVEFPEYTDSGKPAQPIAVDWREDHE